MNDLPKKRQTFSDGLICLASKMEIQRFAFSSIFKVTVIAMLLLSVALNMVRTLQKMARKICFNVQQKFDIFREFHEGVERKTSFTNNSFFDVFREGRMSRTVPRKRWKAVLKQGYELRRDLGY